MTFEATFPVREAEQALSGLQDSSPSGHAASAGIRAILDSGVMPDEAVVHVHATTSERMVAVLVRTVEQPLDAR